MLGYTKTTTLGDEDCIILEPREAYQRETSLPANWTRVRLGAFYSLTGSTTDDNAIPVAETRTRTNYLDEFSFGLSNGGGFMGNVGARFVGLGQPSANNLAVAFTASQWRALTLGVSGTTAVVADGVTITKATGYTASNTGAQTPQGTSLFAAFLGIDVTLSGANAVVKLAQGSDYTNTTNANLRAVMADTTYGSGMTSAGGWWSGADVGAQHFFMRLPYLSNRLRIHAVEVTQLA